MRNIIIASLVTIIAIGVFSSCNKDRTYAQRLSDERKKIERFIDKNDINVLREYPKDSVFQEKDFYFDTSSGIYYNVIDSGNGRRIKGGEKFYVRFDGLRYIESTDTAIYSNINALEYLELVYGSSATYSSNPWVAPAWFAPLKNVSDRAKVKMIVPFNMGSTSDKQTYKTAYYELVDYRFMLK